MSRTEGQAHGEGATEETPRHRKWIFLIDDHPMMRAGLTQLINCQPDMFVCGEAARPTEALKLLSQVRPDLVLTDLTMPGRGGLDLIRDMIATIADLRILVISMHDEAEYAEECLRAGAHGYIMKEAGSENLLAALRRVLGGGPYVSADVSDRILQRLTGTDAGGSLPALSRSPQVSITSGPVRARRTSRRGSH